RDLVGTGPPRKTKARPPATPTGKAPAAEAPSPAPAAPAAADADVVEIFAVAPDPAPAAAHTPPPPPPSQRVSLKPVAKPTGDEEAEEEEPPATRWGMPGQKARLVVGAAAGLLVCVLGAIALAVLNRPSSPPSAVPQPEPQAGQKQITPNKEEI